MRLYERWIKETENPFSQLLFIILLLFVTASFIYNSRIGETLISLLFAAMLVLSFRILGFSHKLSKICVFLVGFSYLLQLLEIYVFQYTSLLRALPNFVYAILLAISIIVLSKQVFQEKRVTGDTLRGSTCIYFLWGYFWFSMYQAIACLDANAFFIAIERSGNALLYFSFVTLTTMGYGDIVPVNALAMASANMEGIVGVLYPAVFIARLVSIYTTQSIK